jgi:hypothetical protein
MSKNPVWLLWLGLLYLLCAAVLLKSGVFATPIEVLRLRGAIAFNIAQHTIQPIKIIGYSFNDDFCEYLRGFIQENMAYGRLFTKPQRDFTKIEEFRPDDLNYQTIINSVLEFVVLKQLDLHLNTYFVENEIDPARITTLTRDGLDPAVLKNRVIELITRDMKERQAFTTDSEACAEKGVVVYAEGEGGAVFDKLEIELPPESRIYRRADGFLVISNPLFDLTIKPKFEGFGANIPDIFTPSKFGTFKPLLVIVKIETRIKLTAFISSESMEIYEWLDSFLARMDDYISTDKLEKRLDPQLIRILKS